MTPPRERRTGRRASRNATGTVEFDAAMTERMREALPGVADRTVEAIIDEVPSYENALSGPMGETIRSAVQLALGVFLNLAAKGSSTGQPMAPALEGAYQLGRGEARSGRTMEALLAAYRIGARVSWRDMSRTVVEAGMPAQQLSQFAELVFAYIDELSAASAAGHTDELESSGRIRTRNLERLARALLTRAPAEVVVAAAERADWEPPATLTAVLMPESRVGTALSLADPRSLQPTEDLPVEGLTTDATGTDGLALLLVAGSGADGGRAVLLRGLAGVPAVVGPTVSWLDVASSFDRTVRAAHRGVGGLKDLLDTDELLPELVLAADPAAVADLRARVLAPLAGLRPSSVEKLTDTLRAWLLHQGRRDDVAAALFVHPQTVRYRIGQLREVYGDRLDDPRFVLEATIALA